MQNRFLAEKCNFRGIFGKISKEMLILIHIPSYRHIFCQIFFVTGKLRITEFNHQPYQRLEDSPRPYPYDTANYDDRLPKKVVRKNHSGLQPPPSEDEG